MSLPLPFIIAPPHRPSMRTLGDAIATEKVDYIYEDEETKAELERFKNGRSGISAEHLKAKKLDNQVSIIADPEPNFTLIILAFGVSRWYFKTTLTHFAK